MNYLLQDVKYLKGVGPARAELLKKEWSVQTVDDLLHVYPYKYIDRSVIHKIRDLQENMSYVQLYGQMVDFDIEGSGSKRRLKAVFTDGSGFVELVWFNSVKTLEKSLKVNQPYLLLGKPAIWGNRFSIVHPELETPTDNLRALAPMQAHYRLTDKMKRAGITSKVVSDWIKQIFHNLSNTLHDSLPVSFVSQHNLIDFDTAVRTIHAPKSNLDLPQANRRLKFEELFFLQLDILKQSKNRKERSAGFYFPKIGESFHTFYSKHLPFTLTKAQQRVVKEIRADMATGRQMNRLLQGDVGSGKTLVALLACLIAVDNKFQACIMAPTEILAEQHLQTLKKFLGDMPLSVELLTGSTPKKKRNDLLNRTASGEVNILIGTHALIEPTVVFNNLGLVIIDEQHRFGVKQRAQLWLKNTTPPHVLVMTATPIPRTLAMTVYGDLDISVIDELPPGRTPIKTLHYTSAMRSQLVAGIKNQLREGRQAYVVFPLIEESESLDLKNLQEGYSRLCDEFPDVNIGQVHGRMKPADKEKAMQLFVCGVTSILVSTTVIEVGVNVPNASVMVIEDADRFGLSQLHQLRGRVGRGAAKSYCILLTKSDLAEHTLRRMQIMTETTDGFIIAEEDLKLRGPGDLEGTAQSGMPFQLKVANILKDSELMLEAREAAKRLLDEDGCDSNPQYIRIWNKLKNLTKRTENFQQIS